MKNSDLCWMPASELARRDREEGSVSPVEVVDAVLARIDTLKPLNAFVTLDADRARARTRGPRSAR